MRLVYEPAQKATTDHQRTAIVLTKRPVADPISDATDGIAGDWSAATDPAAITGLGGGSNAGSCDGDLFPARDRPDSQ